MHDVVIKIMLGALLYLINTTVAFLTSCNYKLLWDQTGKFKAHDHHEQIFN